MSAHTVPTCAQISKVVYPKGADWLAFKMMNLIRFFRLIKIKRKLSAYLVSPWTHLGSVVGFYMLSAHCLACLLFFIGRWQLLNLERGGPNDFVGARTAGLRSCKLM